MNLLIIANVVLVLGALTGMYCIAHHQKKGFIIFLGVEASMSYIGVATNNYGLVIAAVLYLIMNVYSYTKWTQAEKPRRAATNTKVYATDEELQTALEKTMKRYHEALKNLGDR